MTRRAMFDAVRPLAPGRTLTPDQVRAGDAFADALGLPEAVVQTNAPFATADVRKVGYGWIADIHPKGAKTDF